MKNALVSLVCLVAVGLAPGCNRKGPPSQEYQQARALWLDLLRDRMDKACVDPGAAEVLGLLAAVPRNSVDAPVADALKAEIDKCRVEAEAAQAELEKQLEQARVAARPVMPERGGGAVGEMVAAAMAASGAVDGGAAGVPGEERPAPGMSASEFKARFARCFEFKNAAMVDGQTDGEVWGVKDLGLCREQYRDFLDRAVLLFQGRINAVRSKADLSPKTYRVENGKLVLEDGKSAPPPPPPPASAPAPSAGPGTNLRVIAPEANPSVARQPETNLNVTNQP